MKKIGQKFLISVAFVTFSYLISYLRPDVIGKVMQFFGLGFDVTLSTGQFNRFEMVPVFTVWAILGIFAYLLYLSLSNVYYEIYNSVVLKLSYKKPEEKIEIPKIMIAKRIGIHLLVVFSFLTAILFLAGMVPASNLFRHYVEKNITPYFPGDYAFWLSFLPALLIWFLVISILLFLYEKVQYLFFGAKIEEEHRASF